MTNTLQTNIAKGNVNLDFRLKKQMKLEIKNLLKEIKQWFNKWKAKKNVWSFNLHWQLKSISQSSRKGRKSMIKLCYKNKLNTNKVLISKVLIDSYINHDEFVLVNILLREYNEIKEDIKNPETSVKYTIEIWLI